jgi:hypothetical protein
MAGIHPEGVLLGLALAEGHAFIMKEKHYVVKMFYARADRDFIHGLLADAADDPNYPVHRLFAHLHSLWKCRQ